MTIKIGDKVRMSDEYKESHSYDCNKDMTAEVIDILTGSHFPYQIKYEDGTVGLTYESEIEKVKEHKFKVGDTVRDKWGNKVIIDRIEDDTTVSPYWGKFWTSENRGPFDGAWQEGSLIELWEEPAPEPVKSKREQSLEDALEIVLPFVSSAVERAVEAGDINAYLTLTGLEITLLDALETD